MIVYCYNDECKYYQDDMCCREAIDINEDGICDDFENFRNAPEYKQKYWIAKSSLKTHKPYKCLRYGKKITINNVDFYTEDNTLLPETTIRLTHARTGCLAGTMDFVKANFAKFMAEQELARSVIDLPKEGAEEDI